MDTLLYMPPWSVKYDYAVNTNIVSTSAGTGFLDQRKVTPRRSVIASATRELKTIQLPYFEYFLLDMQNDATKKYIDVYADGNGLNTGPVRIVDGAYTITSDIRSHVFSCKLEVFF